jgi:hypothetical protein
MFFLDPPRMAGSGQATRVSHRVSAETRAQVLLSCRVRQSPSLFSLCLARCVSFIVVYSLDELIFSLY